MMTMSVWGDIWNGIIAGLNWLLQGIYGVVGNYGVAIILLTILVKLVLLPLTIKQTRSMIAMQKVQPEIKKLQEKYKDDKERLSQEMMKFYKENKVNPLGGCLPLLLQLPVFFALFIVLRKYLLTPPTMIVGMTFNPMAGFYSAAGSIVKIVPKSAGFLWMNNLADTTRIADPTYILLILLAVSTWYSQKQVMTDPRQKNMLYIMPIVTGFIGLSLPAGVVLYWLTTNILQILQQIGMEYYDKKHPKEEPDLKGGKKAAQQKALAAKDKESGSRKGKAPPEKGRSSRPSKGKAQAKPGATGKKPKAGSGQIKGAGKAKGSPSKGSKPAQVRKPKSPPPQQQGKSQRSSTKKGSKKTK